jgi:hypothetical protein
MRGRLITVSQYCYLDPHKGVNYLSKQELLEVYAKSLHDFTNELTNPERSPDGMFLRNLTNKYTQAVGIYFEGQELQKLSQVRFINFTF